MTPETTALHYDQIAAWWQDHHKDSSYGLSALERAMQFAEDKSLFLDVGCGSSGRFIRKASEKGFRCEGLDISSEMIRLARIQYPQCSFYNEDICQWNPLKSYDLIAAWDSIFHLPKDSHEPVLKKLCGALRPQGVLLFTCGDKAGEVSGEFAGQKFEYSSLGVRKFTEILNGCGCEIKHLEHDQWPLPHVAIICSRL